MFRAPRAYWSGETLAKRLPQLISPYDPDRIDCASYLLSVGSEVYVSPSANEINPEAQTIRKLGDDEAFPIPAGQFAFLITSEVVTVPPDALAFISIRAKTKFKGLVNISGFHVDPGYRGRLIFSVFNAGPVSIHLKQGQEIFVIWFASLDKASKSIKDEPPRLSLDPDLIQGISGDLQSLSNLNEKIKEVDKRFGRELADKEASLRDNFTGLRTDVQDRVNKIESQQKVQRTINRVAAAIFLLVAGAWLKGVLESQPRHSLVEQSGIEARSHTQPTNRAVPVVRPAEGRAAEGSTTNEGVTNSPQANTLKGQARLPR